MKKAIIVMSHDINEKQKEELINSLGVTEIETLSLDLKQKFSNVQIETYTRNLNEILEYLKNNTQPEDILVVQGQAGYQYQIVKQLQQLERICVFAFTERVSKEVVNEDGTTTKTSVFEHKQFIEY